MLVIYLTQEVTPNLRFKMTFGNLRFLLGIQVDLAGYLCLKVDQEATVLSEGSAGAGSSSKLTRVVVGRVQVLTGCWLEAAFSSFPEGPLHGSTLYGSWLPSISCAL